jgi:hypothetical protein
VTPLLSGLVRVVLLAAAADPPVPPSAAAPDPRRGERLDGRAEAAPPAEAAGAVPRLLLSPMRALAWAVFTPIDRATAFAERHHLYDRAYEALTSDDRRRGVRPLVRYQSDSRLAGGLRLFDRRTLGPGSYLGASLRAGVAALDGSLTIEPPGATDLQLRLAYDRRQDALYGGDGQPRDVLGALGQPVVRYGYERLHAALVYHRPLGRALELAVKVELDRRRYGNGLRSEDQPPIEDVYCLRPAQGCAPVDPSLVPGFVPGVSLARGGIDLLLDTRAHPRYGAGWVGSLEGTYSQGLDADRSNHVAGRAAAGGIVAFGDHTLGLHLRAGLVEPLGAAPVPFEELLSPTGQDGLRALPLGRLRGRSEVVATVEYRWLLAAWLDAILFADRGNVFGARFADLSLERTFTSVGLGLVAFDLDEAAYWRSPPRYGVQFAVASDGGYRWSFALHAW